MGVKKKLGLGVMSAALGISLIGGGTWAAFNDTATINNHFAAGTLDLDVSAIDGQPINIDLSNMKPGDSVERVFRLGNVGSLAIKEVLLSATANGFSFNGNLTGTNKNRDAFLDQFVIDVFGVAKENGDRVSVWGSNGPLTLKEFVNEDFDFNKIKDTYEATDGTKRINLASLSNLGSPAANFAKYRGIPVNPEDTDDVYVKITFKNDLTRVAGDYSEYVQNKFMDNSVNVAFNLEATQWDGMEIRTEDANGEVNNKVSGSADDTTDPTTQPTIRTIETPSSFTDVVID